MRRPRVPGMCLLQLLRKRSPLTLSHDMTAQSVITYAAAVHMCYFVAVSAPPVRCVVGWQSLLGGISPLLRHGSKCVFGAQQLCTCTCSCGSAVRESMSQHPRVQIQHWQCGAPEVVVTPTTLEPSCVQTPANRHTGDVVPPCFSSRPSVCCYLAPTCALPHALETNRYNTHTNRCAFKHQFTKQHLLLYTSYLLQRCKSATQYALPHPWAALAHTQGAQQGLDQRQARSTARRAHRQ